MLKPSNRGEKRINQEIYEKLGSKEGLLSKIATCPVTGIIGDNKDLERRRRFFGKNTFTPPPTKSFFLIFKEQITDQAILLLLFMGALAFVVSFWGNENYSWIEGASVVIVVVIITLLASLCDYSRENQIFARNEALANMQTCTVHRGTNGTTHTLINN